ncbi:MAG: hypothetical protein M1835_002596 [Candelina submexicana]|nr:MAG: hypothetical protein M1835_002596 [Candelina submexicana]
MVNVTGSYSLFRALGLDLFRLIFQSLFPFSDRRLPGEHKKIALRKNRRIASFHCAVHILPCVPSLLLAALNIRGYYIGGELPGKSGQDDAKFGALQFAAKVHELSIHASIASMLYSFLRYELTLGSGVPLGALHSGQRFTDLSHLWSIEFWGTLKSRRVCCSWQKRSCFIVALVSAILLAAAAAPASAIALIPRLDMWPACGTSFWLNASNDGLYPRQVNLSHAGGETCSKLGTSRDFDCPSSGYPEIKAFSNFFQDRSLNFVPGRTLPIFGKASTRFSNVTLKLGRNPDFITTATAPQSAIADALVMAAAPGPWMAARYTGMNYGRMREALIKVDASQVVTRVQCSYLRKFNRNTSEVLAFPTFDPHNQTYTSLSQRVTDEFWGPAALESYATGWASLRWIDLPEADFPNATMGAVVVLPSPTNATSIIYSTCNIDSRWAPGTTWRFKNTFFNIWSSPSGVTGFDLGRRMIEWPWPSIKTSIDYANALVPPISDTFNAPTTFASIAETAGIDSTANPTHPQVIEAVLAMLFTNGLARISSNSTLQGHLKGGDQLGNSPNGAEWGREMMRYGDAWTLNPSYSALAVSQDWIKPRLEILVVGYAYSSQGIAIKFALAILLLHVLLAFAHTIYSVWTGLSSSSWDSATEITTLALNSSPSKALQNTCAGIERVVTMGLPVRIMERNEDGTDAKHLELVIGEAADGFQPKEELIAQDDDAEYVRLRTNKAYGALEVDS